MSETVIPIASTPSTRAGFCWARAFWVRSWGTPRTSDNTQIENTLWRRRLGRKSSFMSQLPAHCKFPVLLPILFIRRLGHSQAFHQVVAYSKCVGHDGERRIDGCARWEETPVHDVKVVDVMGFAVHVQYRSLRVLSKANGAVLMSHAGEWNLLSHVEVSPKQPLMTVMAMHGAVRLLHGLLQF